MSKITTLDTPFAKFRALSEMLPSAVAFLTKYRTEVELSDSDAQTIASLRNYSSTPVSRLYQMLADGGKLSCFSKFDYSRFAGDVPELLTLDKVVIDGKYLPGISLPAPIQKCWVNLTPILGKRDLYNSALFVTYATALCGLFVRASFGDNQMSESL
jgi:hypothetical protein